MSLRRGRRPHITPPVPVVVRVDPFTTDVDLDSPIPPDHEVITNYHLDPDETYSFMRWWWGHEYGISWAAYVAGGLPFAHHRWTLKQIHELRFLRDLHRKKDLS